MTASEMIKEYSGQFYAYMVSNWFELDLLESLDLSNPGLLKAPKNAPKQLGFCQCVLKSSDDKIVCFLGVEKKIVKIDPLQKFDPEADF